MLSAPPEAPDSSLGVFETLLVRDRRVQALDAHLTRLAASVFDLFGLELPARLRATIALQGAALTGRHRLRVDAIPDVDGVRIALDSSPLPADGARRVLCEPLIVAGGLGAHKWCDRRRLDVPDAGRRVVALIVDRDGDLLEAAWANVWLREGHRLLTPPADGRLLPGVTRARLLELAPSLGFEALEQPISLARAGAADEIFVTSSLRPAVAASLAASERRPRPGGDGSALPAIRAALDAGAWS